jgi:Na+-driven multidrug efflux pump
MKGKNKIKDQFDEYAKPMIIRSIFQSIMNIADKLVAAVFIGAPALVATTLISPLMFLVGSIAMFFISGLAAYVGLLLGLGKVDKANKVSSGILILMAVVGILLMIPGFFFTEDLAYFLGARGDFFKLSIEYLRIFSLAFPLLLLARGLDVLILNDGDPSYSFALNMIATVLNLAINVYAVVILKMGIKGLAVATVISSGVQMIGGLVYFTFKNKNLRLMFPTFSFKITLRIMYNGFSDFAMSIVESVMIYVINIAFIRYLSPEHFEAYATTTIIFTLFYSIYMGASYGLQPILSKKMGQKRFGFLRQLISHSVKKTLIYGLIAYISGIFIIDDVLKMFITNKSTIEFARFFYISIGFSTLLSNYPLQMSMFFTAINRPMESSLISIFRTLVLIPVLTFSSIRLFGPIGVALGYIVSDIIMIIGVKIFMKRIDLSTLELYES